MPPANGKLFGLNSQLWWQTSRNEDLVQFEVSRSARAGARLLRATVTWAAFQPTPNKPPLGDEGRNARGQVPNASALKQLDKLYDSARAAGMTLILIINDAPLWASAYADCRRDLFGRYSDACAPVARQDRLYPTGSHLSDLASFVTALGRRYPGIQFETWNEPNFDTGPQAVDGSFMGRMQCAVFNAAKALPTRHLVLSPSFGVFRGEDTTRQYMRDFYATGGRCFDRLSVHTYNGSWLGFGAESPLAWHIQVYRAARAEAGDTRPIWVTEFGFSTANAANAVDEATQAVITWVEYNRLLTMPDVEAAVAFTVRDAPLPIYQNPNNIEYGYGWLRADGRYKQVWCDFVNRAGKGPCWRPEPQRSVKKTSTTSRACTRSRRARRAGCACKRSRARKSGRRSKSRRCQSLRARRR